MPPEESSAAPAIEMQLGVQPPPIGGGAGPARPVAPLNVRMDADSFALLHADLKAAKDAMSRLPR